MAQSCWQDRARYPPGRGPAARRHRRGLRDRGDRLRPGRGVGAAGGLGFAARVFLKASFRPGIELVAELSGLAAAMANPACGPQVWQFVSTRWEELLGANHSYFCGAYWANGFHEDGVVSGLRVASAFGETLI